MDKPSLIKQILGDRNFDLTQSKQAEVFNLSLQYLPPEYRRAEQFFISNICNLSILFLGHKNHKS